MKEFFSIDDIVKAQRRLADIQAYEENRKNGNIVEAVLICNPKFAHILKKAFYENNIKNIPIVAVPYAEEDKLYMVTDKEVIDNARKMFCYERR